MPVIAMIGVRALWPSAASCSSAFAVSAGCSMSWMASFALSIGAPLTHPPLSGRAERVWADAADGDDLRRRISALPGFGQMKVTSLGAVLAKRFGVEAAQDLVPNHPTLGDVDSIEALEDYQAKKRAHKAEMRAKQTS